MRLTPFAAFAAACVLTLTACGGDDDSDPDSADKSSSPSASSSDGPAKDDMGKGDKGKGDKPKRPDLGDATICKALDAGAVGEIVDATLKRGKIQNNACVFADPKNPSGVYVGFTQITLEAAGGEEAVATSLSGLVQGEPVEVSDLGDQAYVVVGTSQGGVSAAAGVVAIDDAVVSVGLPVATDVDPDTAKEQVTELLELVTETL